MNICLVCLTNLSHQLYSAVGIRRWLCSSFLHEFIIFYNFISLLRGEWCIKPSSNLRCSMYHFYPCSQKILVVWTCKCTCKFMDVDKETRCYECNVGYVFIDKCRSVTCEWRKPYTTVKRSNSKAHLVSN